MPSAYSDLEIRILAREVDAASGKPVYRVELTLDHGQEFGPGFADFAEIEPWDSTGVETKAAYGERLFQTLFADAELKSAWDRLRGQSPLRRTRLRIDPSLPELHPFQWELLRLPGGGPAPELSAASATPFSRYLAHEGQPGTAILKRPIKVLVAVSNPANLAAFKLQAVDANVEFASLLAATAGIKDEDGNAALVFTLLPPPCTLDAIRDALKEGYHVLHFIGHGIFAKMPDKNGDEVEQAALLLPDPAKGDAVVRVAEGAIADMIGNLLLDKAVNDEDRLRLVFLESCETAKRSSNDAFRGLGPSLVKAGVAAVVAMQDLVEVKTARPFAATFYRQLLRHGEVDLACNEARDAVNTQKLRGADVPVLFMRLRSGELFKVKGRVSPASGPTFWKRVIKRIEDNTCVPFLGPRVNNGILPRPETMARQLAKENGYKLVDAGNLARVAQFEAYKDPVAFRSMYIDLLKASVYRSLGREPTKAEMKALPRETLTGITQQLEWGEKSKAVQECGIYHLLADLKLPLYVTTNVDGFMYEALTHHPNLAAENVRRIGPRWQKMTGGAPPHSVLHPEPNNTTPYVFHLNGFDDASDPSQLEQIVLSEDDLMAKFVRLARDQVEILPSNIVTRLAESSWVFLGYSLDDWEFRVVLQGLLQPIAQSNPQAKLHVGVQLEVGSTAGGADEEDVQAYLQDYLGRRFNINVYWGSPSQFTAELHQRFTAG